MPCRPASPMTSLTPPLHDPVTTPDQMAMSAALSPRSGPVACEPRAPRASPRVPSRGKTKTSRAAPIPTRHRTPSTMHPCILAEADQSDGSELDQPRSRSEDDPVLPAPFHPRPNRLHPCTQLTTPSRTCRTAAQSVMVETTTHRAHRRGIKPSELTTSLPCSPFFSQPLSSPLRASH
jgi:hypothetical protein